MALTGRVLRGVVATISSAAIRRPCEQFAVNLVGLEHEPPYERTVRAQPLRAGLRISNVKSPGSFVTDTS